MQGPPLPDPSPEHSVNHAADPASPRGHRAPAPTDPSASGRRPETEAVNPCPFSGHASCRPPPGPRAVSPRRPGGDRTGGRGPHDHAPSGGTRRPRTRRRPRRDPMAGRRARGHRRARHRGQQPVLRRRRRAARRHRPVRPDPGDRAHSAGPPAPHGVQAHGEDVLAVLDHLGLRQALLVGRSLGAFTIAVAAARHPGRFPRVVLVDGGLGFPIPGGAASTR
ncbi:alpha/beta fold hydrolase [Streptomyces sp. NPDC004284]|uniref:alpha/beta fold hydrolase n=1 Tax=Streptomyces sp. NPDC004284 TaxID=3364695 RepID=UPI0036C4ADEA